MTFHMATTFLIAMFGGVATLGLLSVLVSARCRAVEAHHRILREARRIQAQRLSRLRDRVVVEHR